MELTEGMYVKKIIQIGPSNICRTKRRQLWKVVGQVILPINIKKKNAVMVWTRKSPTTGLPSGVIFCKIFGASPIYVVWVT